MPDHNYPGPIKVKGGPKAADAIQNEVRQ